MFLCKTHIYLMNLSRPGIFCRGYYHSLGISSCVFSGPLESPGQESKWIRRRVTERNGQEPEFTRENIDNIISSIPQVIST